MRMIVSLISFCFFISCTENTKRQYPRYSDFPIERSLSAEVISLDTILFRYPFRVAITDSMALVLDLHNSDHYLHAFSYPGWQHIVSFGERGNGPEELLSAESIRFHSSDSLWVLDANKMQITRWGIDRVNQTADRLEEINLDKQLIRTLDFHVSPAGFIVPDYFGEYRYHLLDRQGAITESIGSIPTERTRIKRTPAHAQAWRSFIGYNSYNHTVALATQLGEVLEVMDLKNQSSQPLYGPNGEPQFQITQSEGIPTGIMGFSDIQVTDSYIYAVFHGRSFKEIEKNMQQGIKNEDGGRSIYVFDLDGNPVIKYVLDRAVYGIYVNEDTNTIIATDVNHDDPIIQFEL
ncbi:TolB-like 6-bladed beta-propeller domain-containing protein [Parabacteroides sp. OttesenSCG-928-G07]|nr:TolB-like 6-bladed beta-propeller domain-containing protein [Parabacteroides sp. OttesenSCG-928-G07]